MDTDHNAPRKHLLSVDDYHTMAQAGIFPERPRVELINGEIFDMAPIGPAHGSVVKQLNKRFTTAIKDEAIVSVQDSIRLGDLSQPEPDLCVLKNHKNFYADAIPQAQDVLLLVEVAHSSLDFDSKTKARLYAAHGIMEYWLVDVVNRQLLIFKEPQKDGFGKVLTLRTPSSHCPDALAHVSIDMSGLFPALPGSG